MRFRMSVRMLGMGIAIATLTTIGGAIPSSAHVTATCSTTTGNFVQAVGFPAAPVLVPMSLPVTVCTLPTNVQVIIPAFRIVGARPGSLIIPSALPVASCTSSFVTAPSLSTVQVLQLVPVIGSASTVVLSTTLPAAVATPLVMCF